jgi:hypothetical protein
MDVVSADHPDFAAQVAEAQRELHDSVVRAWLARDAYRYPIMAYSVALGVLPAFIEEIHKARQPWTRDERKATVRDAVKELRKEAGAFVAEATRRRVMLMSGTAVALLLAGVGGGYLWASIRGAERYAALQEKYVNLPAEFNMAMANHDAERWLDLMRKNTAKGALDGCSPVKQDGGGQACSYTFWTELPPTKRAPGQ